MLSNDKNFRDVENSLAYKKTSEFIYSILWNQWEDVIYSGVLNKVVSEAKKFLIPKKTRKKKVKKAINVDEELSEQLLELESAMEGGPGKEDDKVLNKVAFTLFVLGVLNSSTKSLAKYGNSSDVLFKYLKTVGSKGGQEFIDTLGVDVTFRLSNKNYKQFIKNRVSTLIKTLDNTTKKRLANALVEGVRLGERRVQLVKRLSDIGKTMSKKRADLIIGNETRAIYNYLKFETGKANGVTEKTWYGKYRGICPTCAALNGQKIGINENFKQDYFIGKYPPAHVSCRCTVLLEVENNLVEIYYEKKMSVLESVLDMIKKISSGIVYENVLDVGVPTKVINPNALWAGGESLVGKDKQIGNFYSGFLNFGESGRKTLKDLLRKKKGVLILDDPDFVAIGPIEEYVLNVRNKLTNGGFIQFVQMFGFKPKIKEKK